jgi:hypothetical protein
MLWTVLWEDFLLLAAVVVAQLKDQSQEQVDQVWVAQVAAARQVSQLVMVHKALDLVVVVAVMTLVTWVAMAVQA